MRRYAIQIVAYDDDVELPYRVFYELGRSVMQEDGTIVRIEQTLETQLRELGSAHVPAFLAGSMARCEKEHG